MKVPHPRFRRPSPALVVASLALLVALAPPSYAAVSQLLPVDSVGTPQLKKNSVTSVKIRDFTLRKWDFKQSDLRTMRGPAGAQGPAGVVGNLTLRQGSVTVPAGATAGDGRYMTRAIVVRCQSGERAISGGTRWSTDANQEELITVYSTPLIENGKPLGWQARGGSDLGSDRVFTTEVLCAQG